MPDKVRFETPAPFLCHLIINRPELRNALDRETYHLLGEAIKKAEADDAIRVIILSGEGNCFTSGNDLKDFTSPGHIPARSVSPGIDFLFTLHNAAKPLIAAIEGFAVGIGTTLLNHCDFAYCGQSARFRVPFTRLGLSPEGASTFYFPQVAGYKKASELLLLGDFFSAQDALDCHFVNAVVADGQAIQTAIEIAEKLAALPFPSVLATKKMLKKHNHHSIEQIMREEAEAFHALRGSKETQKLIAGFFEKKHETA